MHRLAKSRRPVRFWYTAHTVRGKEFSPDMFFDIWVNKHRCLNWYRTSLVRKQLSVRVRPDAPWPPGVIGCHATLKNNTITVFKIIMRKDIFERKDEILKWISENKTKGFIKKELNCKYETLENYLKKMGIKYEGNSPGRGVEKIWSRTTAEQYIKNSVSPSASHLRKKLIRDGIKKEECEECGLKEWRGKKLFLELHHIDGNHFNNEFNNLQILCPNCHSLYPNHKNKKPQ